MGNTLTLNDSGVQSDHGLLNEKTDFGKFVKNWALNEYSIHPDAKDQKLFKDTLKKRACCTDQHSIPIGVLGVTTVNGRVKLANHKVGIRVFNPLEPITDSICTLDDADGTASFKFTSSDGGRVYAKSSQCKTFYSRFGDYIKKNRSIHGQINEKLYGINVDEKDPGSLKDSSGNTTHIANQFADVNCINGLYYQPGFISKDSPATDIDFAEQTSDPRCYDNKDKTFKTAIYDGMLCLNIINADVIQAQNNGTIQINQACTQQNNEKKKEIDIKSPPTTSTQTPVQLAEQASAQASAQAATQAALRAAQAAIISKQTNNSSPPPPTASASASAPAGISTTMKLSALGCVICSICCCLLILILVFLSMSGRKKKRYE